MVTTAAAPTRQPDPTARKVCKTTFMLARVFLLFIYANQNKELNLNGHVRQLADGDLIFRSGHM